MLHCAAVLPTLHQVEVSVGAGVAACADWAPKPPAKLFGVRPVKTSENVMIRVAKTTARIEELCEERLMVLLPIIAPPHWFKEAQNRLRRTQI